MKPWEHRSFNVVAGLVTLTGLAYLVMKVFMESDDPFALVNHPWQPTMLSLHVVAAPILVLFFGMIFRSHTLKKLQSHLASNRRTGWTTLTSFGSMALSGYLLQVVTVPAWLDALVWVHVAASLIFVVGYSVHLVIGWWPSRQSQDSTLTSGTLEGYPSR
jgi:hypothetical protein